MKKARPAVLSVTTLLWQTAEQAWPTRSGFLAAVAGFSLAAALTLPACGKAGGEAREILVAAAISLKDAFQEIGQLYESRTGTRVFFNFGASGVLQKQIESGAPVDVFASAGERQMDAVAARGFLVPKTRRDFVRNALVLVLPKKMPLRIRSFQDLGSPAVSRVALGNPKTVPAGQYARQTLEKLKLWARLQEKLIVTENVRQVLDYVLRGEVEAGIVYASDVQVAADRVTVGARAPEGSHDPIRYPIAVIQETNQPEAARQFLHLVLSAEGQAILGKYGFMPVR